MFNRLLLLFILQFSLIIYSQQWQRIEGLSGGTVSGRVFDAGSNEKIEYANIVIISKSDSSVVTGTVSNADGNFTVNRIKPGNYYVDVRFIGFNNKRFEVAVSRENPDHNLGDIYLEPDVINIGDIVVEGERSPVTYQLDKKVVEVDRMQTVVSGNAADVLENVPSVTVDIEGNVSLRGSSNFTVLIDGRPSIIDGQDVLQQTPASSIKSIEIITNPSAKYNPEGTAGIINIILKKNQNLGISGIANANAGLKDKYGGDFLFEYKTENINTVFGLNYNRRFFPGNSRENQWFLSGNNTSYVNSTGSREWGRISFGLRGGVEFLLGESDVLSFGLRYRNGENQGSSLQNFVEWSDLTPEEFFYRSNSTRRRTGDSYTLSMSYQHRFNENGHELKGDFDFGYDKSDESTLTTEMTGESQISGRITTESGPETEIEGKIDYTLPLGKTSKLEAGMQGETEITKEKNGLMEFNSQTGIYDLLPQFSNSNNYNTSELALYSILSDEFGNLGIQGGIRGEYTYRTIEVVELDRRFNIDEWDFFPSVHGSYKFSEAQQLMASYTRRIDRPRGWELEPFDTWMDANNIRRGNPALKPQYIDSYEFGYQTPVGNILFSNEFYYRVTHNKTERIRSVYEDAENVTLHTVQNVGKDYALGSELMFILDPLEIWNINLMGNIYNYKIKGVIFDNTFSRESFNWNTRFNNMFKVGNGTSLQVTVNYNSPTVSSQGRREGFFTTDAAVKQDLFERKLTLTMQIRDIFSTAKYEFTNEGADFYSYGEFNRESPIVMLNIRYNFNNFKQENNGERPNGDFNEGDDF